MPRSGTLGTVWCPMRTCSLLLPRSPKMIEVERGSGDLAETKKRRATCVFLNGPVHVPIRSTPAYSEDRRTRPPPWEPWRC